MRARASLIGLCLAGLAGAQQTGFLGTKQSPLSVSGSGGGIGIMPIIQMVVALAIVLGLLKFVLPKLLGKMGNKLVSSGSGSLKIEESANFAGGSLYVVKAKGKTLLLSASSSGVQCLADLTEDREVESKTEFEKIIDTKPGDKLPDHAVVEEALARLERLAG